MHHPASLRKLLPVTATVLPLSLAAACVLASTTASAAETTYAPPPHDAPPPTDAPPPHDGPAPAPPPNYGPPPGQQPYYGPPPGQQPYYGPAPTYAPPPQPGYGYQYNPGNTEVGRPGGTIQGILGFGGYGSSGFGIGVEGGYTLPNHLYIGGNLTYFADTFASVLLEGQVGYEIIIPRAPVLIRPYGGLGYEHISYTFASAGCTESLCVSGTSASAFIFSLGTVGEYYFTRNLYAGVDLRLDIVTSAGGYTAFDGFGVFGYKF